MQEQQTMQINPEDTTPVICSKCKSEVFQMGFMIRKLSAIMSPDGKEQQFQIPVAICMGCGKPNIEEGE